MLRRPSRLWPAPVHRRSSRRSVSRKPCIVGSTIACRPRARRQPGVAVRCSADLLDHRRRLGRVAHEPPERRARCRCGRRPRPAPAPCCGRSSPRRTPGCRPPPARPGHGRRRRGARAGAGSRRLLLQRHAVGAGGHPAVAQRRHPPDQPGREPAGEPDRDPLPPGAGARRPRQRPAACGASRRPGRPASGAAPPRASRMGPTTAGASRRGRFTAPSVAASQECLCRSKAGSLHADLVAVKVVGGGGMAARTTEDRRGG